MRAGYYWSTLFKDSHAYVHKCPTCQRCASRDQRSATPLLPVVVEGPFQQWGLDIIKEIFPHSSNQHSYILTTTHYFTRRSKAVPLRQVNDQEVIHILWQNIITRFSVPTSLVVDNATYFSSLKLYEFELENGIVLKHGSNYYPQENGLAESTNKNLIRIIKKTIFSELLLMYYGLTV